MLRYLGALLTTALADIAGAEWKAPLQTDRTFTLEEVTVTAQRRAQSLQDTPVAVSALTAQQLEIQGVSNLGDLSTGTVSSLHVLPSPNSPSTLAVAIRGNGPVNAELSTREGSVAIYVDDIYLGRAQGLNMDLADVQRIEILRGPQGTLFGRNATGGAISIVSKEPAGKFGFKQALGAGRFDALRSVTHIDLPESAGVRARFSFLHSKREGWVDNTAPGEADYGAYEKDGGRLSLHWHLNDNADIGYIYDHSNTKTVQQYFQLYDDFVGLIGEERDRKTRTRFPISPLDPTETDQKGHTLTTDWEISDNLQFKSLTAHRELDDNIRNNYGGAAYFFGFIEAVDVEQEQMSKEFRLLGSHSNLEWVAGLYFFKEQVEEKVLALYSLDINEVEGTVTPISPPTDFGVPTRTVKAESTSAAIYGQATWTPPMFNKRLHITLGARYSDDRKTGTQADGPPPFDLEISQTSPAITFDYDLNEHISGYLKWSTAYRGGGVNSRSVTLEPYKEEEVTTVELGLKSEFWDQRLRLNSALFSTSYENLILDVIDPANLAILETINAAHKATIQGLEIEFHIIPLEGLTLGLSYTYLDDEMPLQPNPLAPHNALQQYFITQTPRHAGSLTVDYRFSPWRIGTLMLHMDVTSTDHYHYWSANSAPPDAYTLINARLALLDIRLGNGALAASVWAKNLTDEEYSTGGFSFAGLSTSKPFGEPRTSGIDVTYEF